MTIRKYVKQYASGHVLFEGLFYRIRAKLKYRKDSVKLQEEYDYYNQVLARKMVSFLKKRYSKKMSKLKQEVETEVLGSLQINSKKIWILWLQDMKNAPNVVKLCYESVLKNKPDDYEVILLNEHNICDYVTVGERIIELYKKRYIGVQTYADVVRLELLTKYGGTWIDATVFFANKNYPSYFFNSDLFMFLTLWPATWSIPTVMNCWFMSAKSNDKLLLLTKKLMYEYFKKNKYSCDYWLISDMFEMAKDVYADEFENIIPFSVSNATILHQRLAKKNNERIYLEAIKLCPIQKLNWRYDEKALNQEGTLYKYLLNMMEDSK